MPVQTYSENKSLVSSSKLSTYLAEQSVMEHMMKIISNMDIPPPNEPTTPLYKVLVRKIRSKLRSTGEGMDYLDVEVKARQMARWVEQVAIKATAKSLSNIQARKIITPTNEEIPLEELISDDDENRENILIEKLKDSNSSNIQLNKTGESVTLIEKGGKRIMVEGLVTDNKKKTLVTKESSDGEIGSWVVEVADKEQMKSVEAITSLEKPKIIKNKVNTFIPERKPKNIDEWKTFADLKQMELKRWKTRIDNLKTSAALENQNNTPFLENNKTVINTNQNEFGQAKRNIKEAKIEDMLAKTESNNDLLISAAPSDAFKHRIASQQTGHKIKTNSLVEGKSKNEFVAKSSNSRNAGGKNIYTRQQSKSIKI